MIIFTGNDDAVSFTDEGSPDSRVTSGAKVCINGQVNRDRSLDWYYKIIQFFPDVKGELKSAEVAERLGNFPATVRGVIWSGLGRVKIHIVDPRSNSHRIDNLLRRAWKNDQAPQILAQGEGEGRPDAKYFSEQLRNMVAESILEDSTASRVHFLGRVLQDQFEVIPLADSMAPFFGSRPPHQPLISTKHFRKPKSLIREVTSWSAKSSVAFHSALEAVTLPDEVTFSGFTHGDFLRKKMAAELLSVHAFDDGNQKQLDLLDEMRHEVFQELAAHDRMRGLIRRRPTVVPVESRESFYVQAADIAAGIASRIYAAHGLIGVVEKFEYVSYNGVRVSRSDAEEEMRKMSVIE